MGEAWSWIREALLAGGLIATLISILVLVTGSWPPMVVIESNSMQHDEAGEVGSIDAGDLVLVMTQERKDIITFAEATETGGNYEGYVSHGMPGDVIIYQKNGGADTPVIHRALLKVTSNSSGGWDVPGTTLRNVTSITWTFDILCPYHGGDYNLKIEDWNPVHDGYLTKGDNNDCMIDQPAANTQGQGPGLSDEYGNPVQTTKGEWVIGVAGAEIPWVGSIKLGLSNNSQSVPDATWSKLIFTAIILLAIPAIWERIADRAMETAPEVTQAQQEENQKSQLLGDDNQQQSHEEE
ncbi:MAG: S26 family signal peptidase [Candidatus Thermoplasmatota archaeon]|nr:S26 family signal peptidase [Candidatus Thermoplasmatota archaeon]